MSKKKKNKSTRSPQTKNTNVTNLEDNIASAIDSAEKAEENVEEISDNQTGSAEEKVSEETVAVEEKSEDSAELTEEKASEEIADAEENSEDSAELTEEKASEEIADAEENSEDSAELTEEKASEEIADAEENSEDSAELTEEKDSEEIADAEENSEDSAELTEEKASEEKAVVEENNIAEKVPDRNAEKQKSVKKQRFYFAFAIVVFLFAAIGVVSSVVFAVNSIKSAVSNDPLKDEFAKFLLPVAGNDVAPFENYDELSNYSKINCSIWNILLNHDTSSYTLSETGEFIISEYDVEFSCKEIFGSSEGIVHRSVGATDMSFVYDSDRHVYSCRKDLRYLNYVPVITEMSESGGVYTLTVEYYLPAMLFLSENMGLETSAEKTMKYIVNHNDGKNTLVAVQFTSEDVY